MGSTEERTNAVFDCLRVGRDMVAVADDRAVRHPRSTIFGRDDVEDLVARGFVMKFPSLEVLSRELGIPFERLRQEVDQYNEVFTKKADYDRMGRAVSSVAEPMVEAPWYAAPLTAKVLLYGGGLAADVRARVIAAEDDDPIPGLYAAGEITGGSTASGTSSPAVSWTPSSSAASPDAKPRPTTAGSRTRTRCGQTRRCARTSSTLFDF